MKRSVGYEIHHETKTIVLSKLFGKAAGVFDSDEYKTLMKIKSALPDYEVCLREIKKAEGKRTYRNLSYEMMEAFITEKHGDRVQDFQKLLTEAPAHGREAYSFVKKWFLDNFKSEINETQKAE